MNNRGSNRKEGSGSGNLFLIKFDISLDTHVFNFVLVTGIRILLVCGKVAWSCLRATLGKTRLRCDIVYRELKRVVLR